MSNSDLVANEIYRELFDNYLPEQVDELDNTQIGNLDAVYVPMFEFYRSCSPTDKHNIIAYLKEIVADTTSIVLGGIDQTDPLGELSGRFELTYDGEVVSGNLQESFLSNFDADDERSDTDDQQWDNGVVDSRTD